MCRRGVCARRRGAEFRRRLHRRAGHAWAIRRHPPAPHPPSRLPAERLSVGINSGVRFAWHSPAVFAQPVCPLAYAGASSALWALLPVIAAKQLGMGAAGFGFLIGCMGTGAVAAGFVISRIRMRWGLERLVAGGCIGFAPAMLVTALLTWRWGVNVALLVAGASWMAVLSTFNTATQTSAPAWVRSRALAMHALCALGAFSLGAAFWGRCRIWSACSRCCRPRHPAAGATRPGAVHAEPGRAAGRDRGAAGAAAARSGGAAGSGGRTQFTR
jgi:hypothetical protein